VRLNRCEQSIAAFAMISRAPPQRPIDAVPLPPPLMESIMFDTPLTPPGDDRHYDQEITHCEHSIHWTYWALGVGFEAFSVPAARFAALVRDDRDYARAMVEFYKMMVVERASSAVRDQVAAIALDRIRRELNACGLLPVVDPLNVAIDYSRVPLACGIPAAEINAMRPERLILRVPL